MIVNNGGPPVVLGRRLMGSTILTDGISLVARFFQLVEQAVAHKWVFNKETPSESGWQKPVRNCCSVFQVGSRGLGRQTAAAHRGVHGLVCCAACLVQHFRKKGWVEVAGVKQQLPTASMDAMREVLGAHSDAKGLAAFNSATNGLYHPNALPRGPDSENAAQRPASAQFKAADPGHASPLTMHTGLTIASRHLGRANPIVPPKPERVECVESLLSQARGVVIPCADFSVTNSSQA